jgi:chromodomain-containing protein
VPDNDFPTRNQTANDCIEDVKRNQQTAISALNKTAGKAPTPSPYQVGDQVWLEATHLCLPYQSTKLAPKCHSPFSIAKVVSPVAFQLHIPMAWNIHDVFHASLLSPYHESLEHGPNYSRPLPDLLDGEEEYEVECIINHRHSGRVRTLQYLIKWKGYPEADNTWEPADLVHAPDLIATYHRSNPLQVPHKREGARKRGTIRSSIVTPQQCLMSLSAPRTTCRLLLGCLLWHRPKGSGGTAWQSRAPGPSPSKRSSKGSKTTPTSMQGSSKTSSEGLGVTPPSDPLSPKSKEDPCPHDPCKTSSRQMKTLTQTSYRSSSTAWASPWRVGVTSTTCNASSWRNAKRQPQQDRPQSYSDHSLTHLMGISRTGDKSGLKSPAATGTATRLGGSGTWIKDGWPDTLTGTPRTISQLSSICMPQSTTGEPTRCLMGSQDGSSLRSQGPPPHSPHSAEDSMRSPKTIGDMWQKLIVSVPLMSSTNLRRCKSTNSSTRWRYFVSSCSSPKDSWRWVGWPNKSSTYAWGSTGPIGSMTKSAPRPYRRTSVDVGVHSDKGSGVTGLRGLNPL